MSNSSTVAGLKSARRPQAVRRARNARRPRGTLTLALKLDISGVGGLGPGKIQLLDLIHELGSISAAGRAIPMSYRRAWGIVDSLNQMFSEPVVISNNGGAKGGGAVVTPKGLRLIECYRTMQRRAKASVAQQLLQFQDLIRGSD